MTIPQLYLNLRDNKEPEPVSIELYALGRRAGMVITSTMGPIELLGDRQSILQFAHMLAEAAREQPANILDMSPSAVIAYFEQSPILRQYADDVKQAIGSHHEAATEENELQEDISAISHLLEPSKADIAEVLFGSRYYGGRNYKRVKSAYDYFYSSSSRNKPLSDLNSLPKVA